MKTYCINLDRRTDRREYMESVSNELGLEIEFFHAYDDNPGWKGCAKSHLAILSQARPYTTFLVLEDDVKFLVKPSYLSVVMQDLPNDWDALYLGASPQEKQKIYSPRLYRLKNAKTTHAILWHYRVGGAIDYILENKDRIEKIDVFFMEEVMPKFNIFMTRPMMATQQDDKSDTCKRTGVETIYNNYQKYCK